MPKILIIQNVSHEKPGLIQPILEDLGATVDVIDLERGGEWPELKNYDALIVLGGPDSANDETEKMKTERQRVDEWLHSNKPYLGICLGMQVLAKVAGGKVLQNPVREVGYRPDENLQNEPYQVALLSESGRDWMLAEWEPLTPVFQLHGETVAVAETMEVLGLGKACRNQIIKVGSQAYGFQFHIEVTEAMLEDWMQKDAWLMAFSDAQKDQLRADFAALSSRASLALKNFLTHFVKAASTLQVATFGAGCFWGVQETFRAIPGVMDTAVGYMGGKTDYVTYREVCSGSTDHAEVVHLIYDPAQVAYETLLDVFFQNHNPTTLNQQGPDYGTQYRSVIFTHTADQATAANAAIQALENSKKWRNPVVTQVVPAAPFWRAEVSHQLYLAKRGLISCHL